MPSEQLPKGAQGTSEEINKAHEVMNPFEEAMSHERERLQEARESLKIERQLTLKAVTDLNEKEKAEVEEIIKNNPSFKKEDFFAHVMEGEINGRTISLRRLARKDPLLDLRKPTNPRAQYANKNLVLLGKEENFSGTVKKGEEIMVLSPAEAKQIFLKFEDAAEDVDHEGYLKGQSAEIIGTYPKVDKGPIKQEGSGSMLEGLL